MQVHHLPISNAAGDRVRGRRDPEGSMIFSVIDFTKFACEKPMSSDYGTHEFKRQSKEGAVNAVRIRELTVKRKFPGNGQRDTPCMTLAGLREYLGFLQGKVTTAMRDALLAAFATADARDTEPLAPGETTVPGEAVTTVTHKRRHVPADTLVQELTLPPVPAVLDARYEVQEHEMRLLSYRERTLAHNHRQAVYFKAKAQAEQAQAAADKAGAEAARACADADAYVAMNPVRILKMKIDMLRESFPDQLNNDRTRLQLQDLVNHTLFRPSSASPASTALTCASSPVADLTGPDPAGSPMSISDLCLTQSLSFTTADMIKLGKRVADGYRQKYGPAEIIGTHAQQVAGRMCMVKHYVQKDHAWIGDMIRAYR